MITSKHLLKHGRATPNGIVHKKTGEMLKRRRMTTALLNEFVDAQQAHDIPAAAAPVQAPVAPPVTDDSDLESMTKVELEDLGRDHGVELDRREKKSSLINVLKYLVK